MLTANTRVAGVSVWWTTRVDSGAVLTLCRHKARSSNVASCLAPLEVWKFIAEVGVAVGTIALAIFTAVLAAKTKALAAEGIDAAAAAERQHRQQLMPLCKFSSNSFEVSPQQAPTGTVASFKSPGALRNAGPGPAFHVRVIARLQSKEYGTIWADPGPLGPGEEIPPLSELFTDFPIAEAQCNARIEIEYEDLFQQRYKTVYMHDPDRVWTSGPDPRPKGPGSC
jgi:hypothetical protein